MKSGGDKRINIPLKVDHKVVIAVYKFRSPAEYLIVGVFRSIVLNYCVYVLYIIQIMSLSYYVSLLSEIPVVMSVAISAQKLCSV